ncbi:MAG: S-methyl-5-thioribose-1-phosphate isomerase [Ectothiorhodospiraceae bacterium]|nr:S-methyl-5-thioribose-1-phosphate isomerase [Ectothiorhodospiraceae bacterium]MCH8506164.1 S-methyl-5-thioribose-1-phosphate isomerase [Ectothiorhodospiraceae bacterium]
MQPHDTVRPIRWREDGLYLLDQRLLPAEVREVLCADYRAVAGAITDMVVRGAPAIGIAAAYGAVLAARECWSHGGRPAWLQALRVLAESRPTAVNLAWALERMAAVELDEAASPEPRLLEEARAIEQEDLAANHRMGRLGAALIPPGSGVLTHCNTGSLATGGFGTALGVIRQAWAEQRLTAVYADETRPWLQGARLTAWELQQDGVPVTLLADAAAPLLMLQGKVAWVVVGADRVTANGDVANKIGTYGLAVAARYHGIGFMVVAPASTVDMQLGEGSAIPLEHRGAEELLSIAGRRVAPDGADAWNPVFDVTPAELVDVLVTERGVVQAPNAERMAELFGRDTVRNRVPVNAR